MRALLLTLNVVVVLVSFRAQADDCPPTMSEATGPLFAFEAPERSSVGRGHTLRGTVKSSADCSAIFGAKLEFWLTNEDGHYDEDHRATVFTDESGGYLFESNFPAPYHELSPRIYVRASAEAHQTIVALFEPEEGQGEAVFDIVLPPLPTDSR